LRRHHVVVVPAQPQALSVSQALRCHAREGGHPVTRVGVIKADTVPFIQSGDYWIVRFRGR